MALWFGPLPSLSLSLSLARSLFPPSPFPPTDYGPNQVYVELYHHIVKALWSLPPDMLVPRTRAAAAAVSASLCASSLVYVFVHMCERRCGQCLSLCVLISIRVCACARAPLRSVPLSVRPH